MSNSERPQGRRLAASAPPRGGKEPRGGPAFPCEPSAPQSRSGRVWDLPTRLFHWILALTVMGSVVTGQVGGNAMTWHTRLGLLVLALLVFRSFGKIVYFNCKFR